MNKPPLFFDTVVLSNFAFVVGGINFLKQRYKDRGKITLQVKQDLKKAIYVGYQELEELENKIILNDTFQSITLQAKEQGDYLILLRSLGEGEASCIVAASNRNGVVATDDRMARNFCKEKNIPITGTIGILKAAVINGTLSIEDADEMLQQMIRKGFYSPVNKISNI